MNFRLFSVLFVLSIVSFACATQETQSDKKVQSETKVESEIKTESAIDPKVLESTDQLGTVGAPTDTIHPYRRTDGPKSIEVQIVKPNGEPTVTDSADPNLLSGGGANMGVQLMSKKEAAKTSVMAEVATGIPAEKALGWLKNGNTRFVKGSVRRDGQGAKDRKRVSQKQSPHAFVVACSESIAPPELVFDQKLGEIGVARNLGASVDDSVIRAMEDSVQRGAQLVVLLSHSGCTSQTEPHDAAIGITAKSKMLDALVKSGSLTIKTAIYDQDNGRVSF